MDNYYYMIQALKKGETFDAARDRYFHLHTILHKTSQPQRLYQIKDIFSSNNKLLHDTYLEK